MLESTPTPDKRSNGVFWIVGAIFAVLIVGCIVVFAAGIVLLTSSNDDSPAATKPVVSATNASERRPLPTPFPSAAVIVAAPENGMDYETATLINIYAQVNPSVVNVTVLGGGGSALPGQEGDGSSPNSDPDELFRYSSGSGFVWDTLGHIVTNNHVVDDADQVQVTFADGAVAIAKVVGVNADSDIAVLRIDPEGYALAPIRRGDMEEVRVGVRVAAIGNPFGLEGTLTTGIVSAIGRSIPARGGFSIPDSIQTDAAINPGNSGGPLLNERGELIGINAQIRSEVRANSGVGFAIPVTIVERVVPTLIENGVYEHSFLGVSGGTFSPLCADDLDLPKTVRGAMVLQVLPNTPADRAGLRGGRQMTGTAYPDICPSQAGGDLIIAVDGQPVTRFDDLLVYLQRYTSPGDTVRLTVLRDNRERSVEVTLSARPE